MKVVNIGLISTDKLILHISGHSTRHRTVEQNSIWILVYSTNMSYLLKFCSPFSQRAALHLLHYFLFAQLIMAVSLVKIIRFNFLSWKFQLKSISKVAEWIRLGCQRYTLSSKLLKNCNVVVNIWRLRGNSIALKSKQCSKNYELCIYLVGCRVRIMADGILTIKLILWQTAVLSFIWNFQIVIITGLVHVHTLSGACEERVLTGKLLTPKLWTEFSRFHMPTFIAFTHSHICSYEIRYIIILIIILILSTELEWKMNP